MKLTTFLFFFLFVISAQSAVWQDTNSWNADWETKFSTWVEMEWNQYIFTDDESPYKGIPTDCADASYAMRAIFAFENGLPFAATDPTRNSKKPISNQMKRWDKKLTELERLKSFIEFLSWTLNTSSMPADTVPVALNSESLIPGIIYVKPRVHSYQIVKWSQEGIPVTLNSTTPYSIKNLHKYLSFPAYIPEDTKRFNDGYRRFKRPDELYKPLSSLEGYSLEQFQVSESLDFNVVDFNDYIIEKTHTIRESVKAKTRRLMFNICYSAYNRVSVINESTAYFNKIVGNGRQCMNASEFDQYSTFSRDSRLKEYFVRLKEFMEQTEEFQYEEPSSKSDDEYFHLKPYVQDIFTEDPSQYRRTREQFLHFCEINYDQGKTLDARQLWQRVKNDQLVQNPNTHNDWRWGEYSQKFRTSCPTFEEVH